MSCIESGKEAKYEMLLKRLLEEASDILSDLNYERRDRGVSSLDRPSIFEEVSEALSDAAGARNA